MLGRQANYHDAPHAVVFVFVFVFAFAFATVRADVARVVLSLSPCGVRRVAENEPATFAWKARRLKHNVFGERGDLQFLIR